MPIDKFEGESHFSQIRKSSPSVSYTIQNLVIPSYSRNECLEDSCWLQLSSPQYRTLSVAIPCSPLSPFVFLSSVLQSVECVETSWILPADRSMYERGLGGSGG